MKLLFVFLFSFSLGFLSNNFINRFIERFSSHSRNEISIFLGKNFKEWLTPNGICENSSYKLVIFYDELRAPEVYGNLCGSSIQHSIFGEIKIFQLDNKIVESVLYIGLQDSETGNGSKGDEINHQAFIQKLNKELNSINQAFIHQNKAIDIWKMKFNNESYDIILESKKGNGADDFSKEPNKIIIKNISLIESLRKSLIDKNTEKSSKILSDD